jgi:predicted metal-binding protein
MPSAEVFATLIRAALAHAADEVEESLGALSGAVAAAARTDMELYEAAARLVTSTQCGGDQGARLERQAAVWMEAQGIQRPSAMAAMLAPGCRDADLNASIS